MAIPTIASITPTSGLTVGKQVIEITGTNFRTFSVVPTVPQAEAVSSVRVLFGTIQAPYAEAVSSTLIRVQVPDYREDPNLAAGLIDAEISRVSFSPVGITVKNVNAAGADIVGETATLAAAYTYQQPLIRLPAGDPPILQVYREFLRSLKRCIVSRVAEGTHTDFAIEGATFSQLSEHPSIGVKLTVQRDAEYGHYDNEKEYIETATDVWDEYAMKRTVMLQCQLTISAMHEREVQHMLDQLIELPLRMPWLKVPRDINLPGSGPAFQSYALEIVRYPEQLGGMNKANISAHSMLFRIRGVPLLMSEASRESIRAISTLRLYSGSMQGTTFSSSTF